MQSKFVVLFASFLLSCRVLAAEAGPESTVVPPAPERELRGVWVATVANIDWPSEPGLPVEKQKSEFLAILDNAQKLNLNAIFLQVRPACDALYKSSLEPWSEYLTGEMGKAPSPDYDPLEFAIKESHSRGIKLHAWVNPYRARHPSAKSPVSADHVSKRLPDLVVAYGKHLWLDPGKRAVREYSLNVILEILNKYDVDGIHMDDYFYPYKEKDDKGETIEFPDDASYAEYQKEGGDLNRESWRRSNVNNFIERVYKAIKTMKPHVEFGVSPFGIWQPGYPQEIQGFNAYTELYCDSLKWWTNGWCDYIAPQLYWKIEAPAQSYPVLLKWWAENNVQERHLWAGNFTSRVSATAPTDDKQWLPDEIINQIKLTRVDGGASGNIHFSMKAFLENRANLNDRLSHDLYSKPALTPAMPWLSNGAPATPEVSLKKTAKKLRIDWKSSDKTKPYQWLVQKKNGEDWSLEILPGNRSTESFDPAAGELPTHVAVTAIDRAGVASPATVVQLTE